MTEVADSSQLLFRLSGINTPLTEPPEAGKAVEVRTGYIVDTAASADGA